MSETTIKQQISAMQDAIDAAKAAGLNDLADRFFQDMLVLVGELDVLAGRSH